MFKDSTYQEKLTTLKPFAAEIIERIKRDLKGDHLKKDYLFAKKYFPGKTANKITVQEMAEGYFSAIENEEMGEKISEFIANRWMLKSSELYGYFEKELTRVNPDFDTIDKLDDAFADSLVEGATKDHGALETYIFSVINSVAFPDKHFKALEKAAHQEVKNQAKAEGEAKEEKSIEALTFAFQREKDRLVDKYEKKLDGLMRKYLRDTDMLKKQVADLQRKLNA